MTAWIELSDRLAAQLSLPTAALPVSDATARRFEEGQVEHAAIALDIDAWLRSGHGTEVQRRVLARCAGTFAYVAATQLLDAGLALEAAEIVTVGVRHVPDDPSLRAVLALARWDCGHHTEALAQFAMAIDQYAAAGQVAPLLSILAARAFADAGRHELALATLEPLIASDPRVPLFWDLVDALESRASAANATD